MRCKRTCRHPISLFFVCIACLLFGRCTWHGSVVIVNCLHTSETIRKTTRRLVSCDRSVMLPCTRTLQVQHSEPKVLTVSKCSWLYSTGSICTKVSGHCDANTSIHQSIETHRTLLCGRRIRSARRRTLSHVVMHAFTAMSNS